MNDCRPSWRSCQPGKGINGVSQRSTDRSIWIGQVILAGVPPATYYPVLKMNSGGNLMSQLPCSRPPTIYWALRYMTCTSLSLGLRLLLLHRCRRSRTLITAATIISTWLRQLTILASTIFTAHGLSSEQSDNSLCVYNRVQMN